MGVYDLKGEAYLKKILMISTGGTIASTPSDDGLTPTVSGGEMVKLIPELEGLCEITVCDLLNLDSSNMQPEYWVAMASACYTALSTGFDGIVITHGTDTMAYSAAALSFMLMNLNKPVVLTGSQIPIEEPKTDGKRNILDAFRVAADGRLAGVYVVFAGRIVPGYCVRKVYSRDFKTMEAINRRLAGKIVKGEVVLDDVDFNNAEPGNRSDYRADLTVEQMQWLAKDLSYVPKGSKLVISSHIPVFYPTSDCVTLYV